MKFFLRKESLLILPVIAIFATSDFFYPISPQIKDHPLVPIILLYSKLLHLAAFIISLIFFMKSRFRLRIMYFLPLLYYIYLVFESYYLYGSFLQYPHVFFKIMALFVTFSMTFFYFNYEDVDLTPLMNIIIMALFVKILLDPGIISAEAFVNHERGLDAPETYLLLLACIFFLNRYLVDFNNVALFKFLLLLFMVVFFQHRTVWVASFGAMIFNLFILRRQNMLNLKRAVPTILILVYFLFFSVSMIFTLLPDTYDKVSQEITNILNPEEETTGTVDWRLLQYESYWPYLSSHFIEGMRLKGFELPIQFFHPDVGVAYFEEGTGHHFHSFYYDRVFYFGMIGLIIFLIIMIYPFYYVIKYSLYFSTDQLSIISFSFSGFLFGISYDLPFFFWTFMGITIAFVEKVRVKSLQDDIQL